ncbi:MAG: dsDNA-specific endonuclease/ATPase MutS2 [Saprospiraceae bacterium]|jgi:dsDNA-specific endonuclease/ATPase MutS2
MVEREFWVGDKVRIIASGKEGVFEGISSDGRARIKWNNKILLTKIQNLQAIQESKPKKIILDSIIASSKGMKSRDFNSTLDLHIEVLNPRLANEIPQIILNHQVQRCEEHIDRAISLNLTSVKIIHGKGTGQLKKEVEHLIAMNDSVRFGIPQHDGGATEVWLK